MLSNHSNVCSQQTLKNQTGKKNLLEKRDHVSKEIQKIACHFAESFMDPTLRCSLKRLYFLKESKLTEVENSLKFRYGWSGQPAKRYKI